MGRRGFAVIEESDADKTSDFAILDRSSVGNELRSLRANKNIYLIILLLVVGLIFRANVYERIIVSGASMQGTFDNGSVVMIQRFGINELNHLDIVVISVNGRNMVKRVVGLPNETVTVENGYILVNGNVLDGLFQGIINDGGIIDRTGLLLGHDKYFLIGDNPNNSNDSRHFGAICINDVRGIVVFQVFPFTRFGFIE